MSIEQRAHELALLYLKRYIAMREVDEPQQLITVYKNIYADYLSQLSED